MIIVTGGSGFIGSAMVWRLNKVGIKNIIVVDDLGCSEKWKNLVGLNFNDYLDRSVFIETLEKGLFENTIEAIIHMGACSSTTETDADYLMENNYRYTARLARWSAEHSKCRFIYASSAATYGDGLAGYSDDENNLHKLRPLNMYGYSKHMFDLMARREGWLSRIAGLKFFNVFGPNEQHKGEMRSVMNKAYPQVRYEGRMSLFKSYKNDYDDGEQMRDFIYIKDAVDIVMYFFENHAANGIYNVGTGIARSWNDVANAMFAATNKAAKISYIEMPENLRDKYQYYTCADMAKLAEVGCRHKCQSLEDSVNDYVRNYLSNGSSLDQMF